eukprot:6246755-Alexandrium_andersonii.AAC.1
MSASLVGSEMCIRDSLAAMAADDRGIVNPRAWWGQGEVDAWPDDTGPVSYTHLTLPTICSV